MLLLSVCLYEFQNLFLCIELCQAMSIYADIILVNARRYLSKGVNFGDVSILVDISRYVNICLILDLRPKVVRSYEIGPVNS